MRLQRDQKSTDLFSIFCQQIQDQAGHVLHTKQAKYGMLPLKQMQEGGRVKAYCEAQTRFSKFLLMLSKIHICDWLQAAPHAYLTDCVL